MSDNQKQFYFDELMKKFKEKGRCSAIWLAWKFKLNPEYAKAIHEEFKKKYFE